LGHVSLFTFRFLDQLGRWWELIVETFKSLVTHPLYMREIVRQIYLIGSRSQLVVCFTGAFIGMVFCAQIFYQFHKVQMDSGTGPAVSIALARELAPIITGLIVAGRVGAAIAAELGSMRVTEQVDALRSMGVHPVDFLVVPRVIGLIASMPLLVAEAILVGIVAAYYVGTLLLGIDGGYFLNNMEKFTKYKDIMAGLIKAVAFGFIIASVSCYKGLNCEAGAEGVGKGRPKPSWSRRSAF
jgi:phospholipid/cholesterol/gamma-HCH transport system permease protein